MGVMTMKASSKWAERLAWVIAALVLVVSWFTLIYLVAMSMAMGAMSGISLFWWVGTR